MSTDFSGVPPDVLRRILGGLPWASLCAAGATCSAWNEVASPLQEAMHLVHLGKKYKHGNLGEARNARKALDCFLRGAQKGSAAAMVDTGLMLWERGERAEAVRWYEQAAEMGDRVGQTNLAVALQLGEGTERRLSEAVRWFKLAADGGNDRAQYSLALSYQKGIGVEQDVQKAAYWYGRAARLENKRAMYNLALCHLEGVGVRKNEALGRSWIRRAAAAGHTRAQLARARAAEEEGNTTEALVYFNLAKEGGSQEAEASLVSLTSQLSDRQLLVAAQRAGAWQPSGHNKRKRSRHS